MGGEERKETELVVTERPSPVVTLPVVLDTSSNFFFIFFLLLFLLENICSF